MPRAEHTVYQGLEGAYSNLTAVQFFSQYSEAGSSRTKTFDAAVRVVDESIGDCVALPIKGSTAGNVADSYDAFAKREVLMIGEYPLPVRHALPACGDTALADIRTVYSYPQSTRQYVPFFEEHSKTEAVAVSNIAIAARLVQAMGRSSAAAITSVYVGQIYSLRVLIPTLGYRAESTTRFLIVGKGKLHLCGAKTVNLMMETRYEASIFYHVLGALYAEGINPLRLAVRPVPGVSRVYRLFLDFSGSLEETAAQRALQGVGRLSTSLHILGCS